MIHLLNLCPGNRSYRFALNRSPQASLHIPYIGLNNHTASQHQALDNDCNRETLTLISLSSRDRGFCWALSQPSSFLCKGSCFFLCLVARVWETIIHGAKMNRFFSREVYKIGRKWFARRRPKPHEIKLLNVLSFADIVDFKILRSE